MRKVRLGEYIEPCTEINSDGHYGLNDVRGVANIKGFIPTKANMDGRSFSKFFLIRPGCFAFNRRTTRNGERLGLGFNDTTQTFICTEDYVVFRIKQEYLKKLMPDFLYLNFLRNEFDRYVRWDSWGSATEFFNWENMCQVQIILPPLDEQKAYVATWQGLKVLADSKMADPLFALCQSYLKELKQKYEPQKIGPYIKRIDIRNRDNKIKIVKSVSVTKEFKDTNAKVDKSQLQNYKIVCPGEASFVQTTGNEKCLCFAVSHFKEPIVVTAVNEVIQFDETHLLADFLYLWIYRKEFDRYARFNSWGSVRELFTIEDMCRVKIPLPPIEVQKAIVAIYRCAQENKTIAGEAAALSKSICPALMRQAMAGGEQ